MKNFLKKKCAAALLVLVAAMALNSCDSEFTYVDELVGSWMLVEANGYPVGDYDADYYLFLNDGTGIYTYYDRFGRQWDEAFYWSRGRGVLYISFSDPSLGSSSCYYEFDANPAYIYFSTDPQFRTWNTYMRVG